jgi:PAS domain S-box-containing protein
LTPSEQAELSDPFLSFLGAHPRPAWVHDAASLRVLRANDAALHLYGYPSDGFLRISLAELDTAPVPADDGMRTHRRADGSLVRVELSSSAVRYQDGDARLVTAREVVVPLGEERFRQALEHAPIGMAVVDPDGRWGMVNRALCRITGYSEEELLRRTFQDITHPADLDADLAQMQALLAGEGDSYELEKRYVRHDGRVVWVQLCVALVRDDAGRPVQFIAQVRDITVQREARVAMRRSEARFRSLIENATDVITVLDADGRIRFESPSVKRILGYDPDELVGRPVMDYVHPDDRAHVQQALSERLRNPGAVQSVELRFRHRDGRWRILAARGANRLDDPAVRAIVVNSRDVTERREAEEKLQAYARELQRSNRELQDFAYVASHDLQEPLRKIQAFGDRLSARAGGALDDQARDYLARMQAAAARMQALIQDLLAYSRVTTRPVPFVPVDLNQVAAEVEGDLQVRIAATEATVEVGPLPEVEGDAMQMRQLLLNLMGNAVKFHRPGVPPVVRVSGRVMGEGEAPVEPGVSSWAEVTVKDEGAGFDEKYLDRIFAPFQRLHGRGEYEGTGMGLAICRRIAERHGGTLEARSQPGTGSAFTLRIPARRSPQQEA